MKFYDNIESERDRVEACIKKYGSTSDHNFDWFSYYIIKEGGVPVFIEFNDGTGILAHRYSDEWRIWSDPLAPPEKFADKISELAQEVVPSQTEKIWCVDSSESVRARLLQKDNIIISKVDYSLFWPVLNMDEYNPDLGGNHFKEIRNAKNKFYREHRVSIINPENLEKNALHNIIDRWVIHVSEKQSSSNVYGRPYHNLINHNFKGFKDPRVIVVDDMPVGINAGYEMINNSQRFVGIVGIHDYSRKDLGTVLWLEDLNWVKNEGYKEFDLQGHESGGGLELKQRFGAKIEQKTKTFLISR